MISSWIDIETDRISSWLRYNFISSNLKPDLDRIFNLDRISNLDPDSWSNIESLLLNISVLLAPGQIPASDFLCELPVTHTISLNYPENDNFPGGFLAFLSFMIGLCSCLELVPDKNILQISALHLTAPVHFAHAQYCCSLGHVRYG